LAAVAVSSAAMAQVTISGAVGARYQSIKGDATAADNVKGFTFSEGQVVFTANEDLGGGTTATASFTIDNITTDSGGAASAALTTAATTSALADGVSLRLANAKLGSVTFSSLESGDYLPLDVVTKVSAFSNGTIADRVTYTSPAISGFTFSATLQEGGVGAGSGAAGEAKVYELSYAAGPLTANFGMLSVDKNVHGSTDGGTRFRVGYNFGVAAVTYGAVNTKDAAGVKDKETGLSVTVPMGAVTLGAQYATGKDGAAAAYKSTGVSATYALSKRTSVVAEHVKYDELNALNAKRTRFTVSHAF
jgi:hypothetical protein